MSVLELMTASFASGSGAAWYIAHKVYHIAPPTLAALSIARTELDISSAMVLDYGKGLDSLALSRVSSHTSNIEKNMKALNLKQLTLGELSISVSSKGNTTLTRTEDID